MCANLNETENKRVDNLDENLEEMSLTIKEAAQYIGESTGVVRNWMRELKSHIPTIQGENGYHYFDKEALERLLLIKQMTRDQNYSLKQINYHFSTGGMAIKPEPTPEASDLILKELADIKQQMELQNDFNQALVQKLEKQEKYITDSLNKRDQKLMESMRNFQQARIEAKEKKGFFARMFSK